MDTRVSMQSTYQDAILSSRRLTDQLTALQAQASTGKKFANISDDPMTAMAVVGSTHQDQLLTAHLANIQSATTSLNSSVSALQQVSDILSQAKSLAIQGSNSGNDPSAFAALAQQVNGLIGQLLSAANSQSNGIYLFGGAAATTAPYVVTRQDSQGNALAVSYQGFSGDMMTTVATNQQIPVTYAGNDIFQAHDRQTATYTGNTGAQAGTGTDSATGQETLTFQHTATTFASGSGVQPGASSAASDTILGAHTLTITDTSGDGSAGTVSLDGGPAIAFTNADSNLQVTNAEGDIVYLNTSAITPGFNGSVAVSAAGTMSLDGGATTTPLAFANNQTVTDSTTGAVTFVDTTNVQRTGAEVVSHPGTYNVFQALIALRDDLSNTQGLSQADQIQAISARMNDLDSAATQVQTALGTQAAAVQSMSTLQSRLQDLQVSTKETISNLGDADATDLVVKLQSLQLMLQLSLETFSKISSTTLLNYMN